jgi:hypothetical protein
MSTRMICLTLVCAIFTARAQEVPLKPVTVPPLTTLPPITLPPLRLTPPVVSPPPPPLETLKPELHCHMDKDENGKNQLHCMNPH